MTKPLNNKRKKATAFLAAGVLTAGVLGGSFATLSNTITDGPTANRVFTEDSTLWSQQYHTASQTLDADISTTDDVVRDASAHRASFVVENDGTIPAHYTFYLDPATVAGLDFTNPYYQETLVDVQMTTEDVTGVMWRGTLEDFTKTAFMTDDVIEAGGAAAASVTIYAPSIYSWASTEEGLPLDVNFGTMFTFSQMKSPTTSVLHDYFMLNAERSHAVFDFDDTFVGGSGGYGDILWLPTSELSNVDYTLGNATP